MRPQVLVSWGLGLLAVGVVIWLVLERLQDFTATPAREGVSAQAVPVETASIEQGPIELRRTFSGTLDARAEFVVAPKIAGRIEQIAVDLADTVSRGEVVARLDNAEYLQAVTQVEADLAVAQANLAEAQSLLKIAERELQRMDKLRRQGVSSESQRDTAMADQLAKQAHVEVTKAQVVRARAALETARIRLGYTEVTAGWSGGAERRVVAERYVDEGETVAANAPLLRIVELSPITAVFFVTEGDYALLQPGQDAELGTDAYPRERFRGEIERIAPVFRESTRQARVELRVDNPELRLKPGMYVRATVVLERVAQTTVVPEAALATREGRDGVFVVAADGRSVRWRQVRVGIREDRRVQVSGEGLSGSVVVLGQQLLNDGSAVAVSGAAGAAQ